MGIYGAKFQKHCFNISRDIVYSVFTTYQLQYYDIITDLICIIEKRLISLKRKKIFQKEKNAILLYFEGLSNKQKNFLCHIHFKFASKLANYFYS